MNFESVKFRTKRESEWENVLWRGYNTHILGDNDLLEVVATYLSLVAHRLSEEPLQPFQIALVDPRPGPAETHRSLNMEFTRTQ
jgi:hypothetical protein